VSTTKSRISTLGLVCIPTPDVDRAIEFYERIGLEKRTDVPFGGQYRWVEVYPPEGTTGIALAPPPQGQPTPDPRDTGITLNRLKSQLKSLTFVTLTPFQIEEAGKSVSLFYSLPGRFYLPFGISQRPAIINHNIGAIHFFCLRWLGFYPQFGFFLAKVITLHQPFQFYQSTANPHHLPPSSTK